MSKRDSTPLDSTIDEPSAAFRGAHATRKSGTPSGFDAAFLSLMGMACVAGGLVLALGPRMSWKLSQITTGFKHLGVEGGVLIMGGMCLAALGMLRRGQNALRLPTPEQLEDRAMIEQLTKDALRLSEDLSRIESGLAHVEAELGTTRRGIEERTTACTREVVTAINTPRENNASEEAIYRLAASLDQVGMRIEQRLKTQYTALQDHLEDVGAAILSARNQVQGLQRVREDHVAALRDEVQQQVETALEETGIRRVARRDGSTPLGVLDTIEDTETADAAAAQMVASEQLENVNAALPLDPDEAREHGVATPQMLQLDEMDTKTRLIQLSSLLADPRLRKALDGMRTQNG